MNNIILCEGSTDYVLLQYYMRKAYQWSDDSSRQQGILRMDRQKSRNLVKDSDVLTIMSNCKGFFRICRIITDTA